VESHTSSKTLHARSSSEPYGRCFMGNNDNKLNRAETANAFIRVISEHGREFFRRGNRVSYFTVDARGYVWFVDSYRNIPIYTHYRGRWRNFSQGGTQRNLVISLRDYICGRAPLPVNQLGPWPDWYSEGDPWGYGEPMVAIRSQCAALAES